MPDSAPIVVVGGLNMDIQGRSWGNFRRGDSNPGAATRSPGGVGRNIAENLVRLGLRVELLTALGDDTLSRELAASCQSLGIGLSGALRLSGTSASQYLCLFDTDGSLVGAVASMDAMERLGPERLEERGGMLDAARLIVVDANLPEASIAWLAERYGPGRDKGPLLALDTVSAPKAQRAAPYLASFAFAKPNLAEARALTGLGEGVEPASLVAELRERGLREVFLSLGPKGIYYESSDPRGGGDIRRGQVRLPPDPPEGFSPVNVSGAGDAACAALSWGLMKGKSAGDRARFALAAALATAASDLTVNPDMNARVLEGLAEGVIHEQLA